MATESLSFSIWADDRASETFKRLGLAASSASGDVGKLGDKLTKLGGRVTTARVKLDGNKEANADLDKLDVKLIRLGNKVADPSITMEGKVKALAEISAVDLAMDRLNRKFARPGFFARTSTWGGLGRTLAGLLPGVSGAGGAVAGGGAQAAAAGGPLLSNPWVAGGAAAAGIAALPFIAQAAAGGITLALGGALTGIGILSAVQSKKVRADWTGLFTQTKGELLQVAQPFVGALKQISQVAQSVLPTIMMNLVAPMKILAPAFQTFSDALLRAFAQPAVANSMQAVAKAFGSILKALAPQLAGDIADVATGITRIANTVSKNPGAFAAVISFFFKAAGFALSMTAALASVANYIEKHFIPALMDIRKAWDDARHQTAVILDGIRHDIAHTWDQIFSNTIGTVIRLGHNVETQFDSLRHGIATAWDTIWRNTVAAVRSGVGTVVNFFQGLPGRVANALLGLGTKLWNLGHTWLTDLWNGIKSVVGDVENFFTSLPKRILGWLGIHSPPGWAIDAGKQIMHGLGIGMAQAHHRVTDATRAVARAARAGPGGGAPAANAALAHRMYASQLTPASWAAWNAVAMAESGWNQFARNPSGAYGIPQALPPTKMPFAAQAAGGSNPMAQISWMWNYMKAAYGGPLGAEAHELSAGWYGSGLRDGLFTRPTLIGVGERGPEMVNITPGRASSSGTVINYNLTVTAPVGSSPRDIGRQLVGYLRAFEQGSGSSWRS